MLKLLLAQWGQRYFTSQNRAIKKKLTGWEKSSEFLYPWPEHSGEQ